ncbi:MAG: 3'-5' exoribonuclease YhaM family protein [Ktedonobacteraceae bacterium]
MENHDHRERSSNPEPIIINDLVLNTEVSGWLFAEDVQNRTTKNGKQYRQLKLRDQRGNDITARHFDLPQKEINVPQAGKVVMIKGVIEEYQNNIQLKLTHAELDETAPLDVFVVRTRRNLDELEGQFWVLANTIQHPGLQALLQQCFTNDVIEQFRRWPAAVRHHGAVVGGLLEHTVNVSLITQFLTIQYSCNQELALAGALLHDIGKLQELEELPGRGFTPDGTLFGHIILGAQYVEQHAKQIIELEDATRLDVLHIILAHHGTKEFGSPVYPATIEALIVHLADMAEAKMTGFLDHCDRTSTPDGWSSYCRDFGGPLRKP